MSIAPDDIVNFWFYEIGPERWFKGDRTLGPIIRERYLAVYEQAARGELKQWEETPEGALALLLLLDQFPRQMFRGTAQAYATDELALEVARNAIIKHFDDRIDKTFKLLFYLPFEHSESMGDQRLALFYIRERAREDAWLNRAEKHYFTIQRFGRFPERNAELGRESTPEELAFVTHDNKAVN